jgi:hypothetical protein
MNNKINEDVMVEFNEVEMGCDERGRSIIEFYDEFGYDSEGGKLIKKYGSEVIRDEFIKKVKEYCEENDEEYYKINWG